MSSRTSKVFALSIGKGLNTVVTLVSGMVMARLLSQTELATYRQTMLAYNIAIPLLSLGIPHGIYYFLPTETKRARGLVIDALIMMVTMGLLYAVFIALGGNHLLAKRFSNPAIVNTLAYLVPLPLIMLPAGLLASVMVVQNRVKTLTIYDVISHLLLAISLILACVVWKTPESMIITRVIISSCMGLIAVYLILSSVPRDDWHPRLNRMQSMTRFSVPLVLASSVANISLQLDKIIVSSMCSPTEFAVYSTGALEIPLIAIVTKSIASVILPELRRMVAAGDTKQAVALFRQSAEKAAVILIPTTFFLMFSAHSFILTLFSSKYEGSVLPFRLYLLLLPARIVVFGSLMTALGLSRMIFYRTLIALASNLILSVVLVLVFGYIGAIIATIVTMYLVSCVWNLTIISRKAACRWTDLIPFRKILILSITGLFACLPMRLAMFFFPLPFALAQLAANAICFCATTLLLVWVFDITSMKEALTQPLDKLLRQRISRKQK